MSFRVLVIPEDFRKDEFLLKPILEKMLEAAGRRATLRVCKDPLLGGVREALKWSRIQEILDRYRGMVDCFLLIVDRDGLPNRKKSLAALEAEAAEFLGAQGLFFAENAWQEIEVWALAGLSDLPRSWNWKSIRAEPNAKEVFSSVTCVERGSRQSLSEAGCDSARKPPEATPEFAVSAAKTWEPWSRALSLVSEPERISGRPVRPSPRPSRSLSRHSGRSPRNRIAAGGGETPERRAGSSHP